MTEPVLVSVFEVPELTGYPPWEFSDWEQHPRRGWQLRMLHRYYTRTQNAFLAIRAFQLCVEAHRSPPKWTMDALSPGLGKILEQPDADAGTLLGVTGRGSGKVSPREQYEKFRSQWLAMADMWKLIHRYRLPETAAAEIVATKDNICQKPGTLRGWYRGFWREFFADEVAVDSRSSEYEWVRFIESFPPAARCRIGKLSAQT